MELSSKAIKRLIHIKEHLDGGFNKNVKIENIKNNTGNPSACAFGLSSHALASAIFSWFEGSNLLDFKNWLYVGSKLDQLYYKYQEISPDWGRGTPNLLKIILSDNEEVIKWICFYEFPYDLKKINKPETFDFLAYQSIVALRGDWETLSMRCKLVEDNFLNIAAQKDRMLDFQFFRGLAEGDVDLMEETIALITSEPEISKRANQESGYTLDLIATDATIYTKIAWRNGYFLNVNSPYVPKEWLPISPLNKYDPVYDFLM